MNRYRAGGPSKATATTVCQKCLKRGHYSYECTASQQDRPYISRPSRTQQLLNPKLVPKLTNDAPKDPTPKLTASEIIKANGKRGRDDDLGEPARKRSHSISSSSSFASISSISTNRSQSHSPPPRRDTSPKSQRPGVTSRRQIGSQSSPHPSRKEPEHAQRVLKDSRSYGYRSRSPPRNGRRRSPSSSSSRVRSQSRGTRRRPYARESRSRSPYKVHSLADDDSKQRDLSPLRDAPSGDYNNASRGRQKSLSPFSKRKALSMRN